MSAVTRPQGPLPSRVYWTRRVLVLLLAFALVFGVGRLLGGGGADPQGESARPVGADPTGQATPGGGSGVTPGASGTPQATPSASTKTKKVKPQLAAPEGPCADDDVVITPVVSGAYAGQDVPVVLELTTRRAPACTWQVSPQSVILAITSGDDAIWSSQHCRAALPTKTVVPRRNRAARVLMVWDGRRSDATCSRFTYWARAGWYHVEAVARGSVRPVDVQFELKPPVRATITPTPTPTPTPGAKASKRPQR